MRSQQPNPAQTEVPEAVAASLPVQNHATMVDWHVDAAERRRQRHQHLRTTHPQRARVRQIHHEPAQHALCCHPAPRHPARQLPRSESPCQACHSSRVYATCGGGARRPLPRTHSVQGALIAGYYLLAFLFGGNPLIVTWIVGNTAGTTKKSTIMSLYNGPARRATLSDRCCSTRKTLPPITRLTRLSGYVYRASRGRTHRIGQPSLPEQVAGA
ncbi:hypothetical protein V1507DRAFT_463637 [Lipomyces tetrasporus]